MSKKVEDLNIEPDSFYTLDQAARMLMEVDPGFTYEEALREVRMAVFMGELPIAGTMNS